MWFAVPFCIWIRNLPFFPWDLRVRWFTWCHTAGYIENVHFTFCAVFKNQSAYWLVISDWTLWEYGQLRYGVCSLYPFCIPSDARFPPFGAVQTMQTIPMENTRFGNADYQGFYSWYQSMQCCTLYTLSLFGGGGIFQVISLFHSVYAVHMTTSHDVTMSLFEWFPSLTPMPIIFVRAPGGFAFVCKLIESDRARTFRANLSLSLFCLSLFWGHDLSLSLLETVKIESNWNWFFLNFPHFFWRHSHSVRALFPFYGPIPRSTKSVWIFIGGDVERCPRYIWCHF